MPLSMSMAASERQIPCHQVYSDRTPNLAGARQFYSFAGATIMFHRDENGLPTRSDNRIVQSDALHFENPAGPNGGKFGLLITADPHIIAFLDDHRAKQLAAGMAEPDILTHEEMLLKSMTPQMAMSQLQNENAKLKAQTEILQNKLAGDINKGDVRVGQATTQPGQPQRR